MYIRTESDKVKEIADHYGLRNQLKQLAEECCELSVEALHYIREEGGTERIFEEMADVLIMIQQVIHLLGCGHEDIEEYAEFKIDRQLKRIEEEQE